MAGTGKIRHGASPSSSPGRRSPSSQGVGGDAGPGGAYPQSELQTPREESYAQHQQQQHQHQQHAASQLAAWGEGARPGHAIFLAPGLFMAPGGGQNIGGGGRGSPQGGGQGGSPRGGLQVQWPQEEDEEEEEEEGEEAQWLREHPLPHVFFITLGPRIE